MNEVLHLSREEGHKEVAGVDGGCILTGRTKMPHDENLLDSHTLDK